ncbi:hypothetical protein HY522_09740 [bacterium]|nr:hypothetical protein [bacterium]
MAVSGLAAPTSIFSNESPKPIEGTENAFGQDTFLKLLVTQLRFQDPIEPVNNEEFLAQMAQFTGLEQMVSLNKSMEKLAGSSIKSDAVSMLGSEVSIKPTGQVLQEGETPIEVTGTVDEIRFDGEGAKLLVNGNEYSIEDVVKVAVPKL